METHRLLWLFMLQIVQRPINNNFTQTTSDLNKWYAIIGTTYYYHTAAVGSNEIRCGFDDFMSTFHTIERHKKNESEAWFTLDKYYFSTFISLNSSISMTQNGLSGSHVSRASAILNNFIRIAFNTHRAQLVQDPLVI